MNFIDTLKSVDLVLSTNEVPLVVGESGIGKTALAKKLAKENNWSLVVIDGNLLKEGEIGGLPTIESYTTTNSNGEKIEKKITVYAVHNKLREIDEEIAKGKSVLLFIDDKSLWTYSTTRINELNIKRRQLKAQAIKLYEMIGRISEIED